MKLLWTLVLCLTLLPWALAQHDPDENEQYRDVTAAGPFPLYMTMHLSKVLGNDDMVMWTENDDARRLDGLGFDLGVKIKRAVFFETGYWHITGTPKGSEDRLTLNTYSARMGWRKTFFYPFGMHIQAGGFVRDTRFREEEPGNSRTVTTFDWQWGADMRLKLTLLDPVGTGGGLGFYIEGRLHYLFGDREYDLPGDVGFERDNFYGAVSVGVMAPIAIRMMR